MTNICCRRRRWGGKCTLTRGILYFTLLFVFCNECLVYWIQNWRWANLPFTGEKSEEVRVLFIADPQIQGYHDELPVLGYLTRWDGDWYLQKTFQLAINHVKPDVIIYLGDLLDEGSHATEAEFDIYARRFRRIFAKHNSLAQDIYIPGDNDVGGEGFDLKTKKKILRFQRHFGNDRTVETVNFLDFVKMNYGDVKDSIQTRQAHYEKVRGESSSSIRIVINHWGLIYRTPLEQIHLLTRSVDPNLLITADIHKSAIINCENCRSERRLYQRWFGNTEFFQNYQVISVNLLDKTVLIEIVVPTCSYRMGVPSMGYGAAVIDKKGMMKYTVLWSPSRYMQLFCYIPLLLLLAGCGGVHTLIYLIQRKAEQQRQKFYSSF